MIRIVAVLCAFAGIAMELAVLFGGDAVGNRWIGVGMMLIVLAGALAATSRTKAGGRGRS